MALKITSALFGTGTTGKLKQVGTFRANKDGTRHIYTTRLRQRPPPSPFPVMSANLAEAKRQHAQGAKHQIIVYGEKRWVLITPWADFWEQWGADHGLF